MGAVWTGSYLERLFGIFITPRQVQKALELLCETKLKLDGFRFQKAGDLVGIPLVRSPSAHDDSILRTELGDFQIREALFERVLARPRTLRDAVHATVPRNLLSELPRSLDVVGDIAILELSPKLEPYSLAVANGILQINPHVRLVLRKASEITGVFRTRELQALGGFGGTETIHREFGCNYRLDASTVYFNPRLAHERQRVAKQVGEGDVVVDMFAGVGPYSILIAKLQPHSRVYALDINPSAINYLKENILTNGVADRVTPLLGDARQLSRGMIQAIADRVIMNLPSDAENYLDAASRILKGEGGYVHFYCFARRGVDLASVREHFKTALSAQRRRVQRFSCCNVVREISPSLVQVAIDVLVK